MSKKTLSNFEWLVDRIGFLYHKAHDIISCLSHGTLKRLFKSFEMEGADEKKLRLWSLKKLFVLAGYIPMYLRIIHRYAVDLGCSKIAYIDLYSGPGLSYIGPERDYVVLGSPLISIFWPMFVEANLKQYKGLKPFDVYVFNDLYRGGILRDILDELTRNGLININYEVYEVSIPSALKRVTKKIKEENLCGLVFLDPPGNLDAQPKIKDLKGLSQGKIDLLQVFQTTSFIRALKSAKEPPLKVKEVLGFLPSTKIIKQDLINQFITKTLYSQLGFMTFAIFPITYKGKKLAYDIILAVKKHKASWILSYVDWYKKKVADLSEEEMRAIWFKHVKSQPTIFDFM